MSGLLQRCFYVQKKRHNKFQKVRPVTQMNLPVLMESHLAYLPPGFVMKAKNARIVAMKELNNVVGATSISHIFIVFDVLSGFENMSL